MVTTSKYVAIWNVAVVAWFNLFYCVDEG